MWEKRLKIASGNGWKWWFSTFLFLFYFMELYPLTVLYSAIKCRLVAKMHNESRGHDYPLKLGNELVLNFPPNNAETYFRCARFGHSTTVCVCVHKDEFFSVRLELDYPVVFYSLSSLSLGRYINLNATSRLSFFRLVSRMCKQCYAYCEYWTKTRE